jgi:hypothetical protein
MRVQILSVDTSFKENPQVHFSSEVGQAWAYWSGDPPTSGQSYHVELSVEYPLTWGVDILPTTDTQHRLELEGAVVAIQGALEVCEEDGFTALRLGRDILMLQTYGDSPSVGTVVRAQVRTLTLSDINI